MLKKSVYLIVISIVSLLFVVGCSSNKKSESPKYYDDEFYTSLEKGLTNRWKLTDASDKKDKEDTQSDWEGYINAELKQISKYKNKKFKSSKLQQLAITYINAVKAQKSSLKYLSSDSVSATEKWNKVYDERTQALNALNKYKKIKVAKKDQDSLKELLGNAQSVNEDQKAETALKTLAQSIKFTQSANEDGWKTYQAVATNTSDYDLKTFQLNVKLIDADGVTVETTPVSTDDWTKGSKVRFEFETDKTFAKYELILDYFEVK